MKVFFSWKRICLAGKSFFLKMCVVLCMVCLGSGSTVIALNNDRYGDVFEDEIFRLFNYGASGYAASTKGEYQGDIYTNYQSSGKPSNNPKMNALLENNFINDLWIVNEDGELVSREQGALFAFTLDELADTAIFTEGSLEYLVVDSVSSANMLTGTTGWIPVSELKTPVKIMETSYKAYTCTRSIVYRYNEISLPTVVVFRAKGKDSKIQKISIDSTPVYTAEDLMNMSGESYYTLQNDLDLSQTDWNPVDKLTGVFDGNGHKISGLAAEQGIFEEVTGIVKNLTLDGFTISGTGERVGALAGNLDGGTVENVKVMSSVIASTSNRVGGLVGNMVDAQLHNIEVDSSVSGISYVGGIVGYSTNSDAKGLVMKGSVLGAANGTSGNGTGGLVGYIENTTSHTFADCDVYADVSGGQSTGGFIGYGKADGNYIRFENVHHYGTTHFNKYSGTTSIYPYWGAMYGYQTKYTTYINAYSGQTYTNSGTVFKVRISGEFDDFQVFNLGDGSETHEIIDNSDGSFTVTVKTQLTATIGISDATLYGCMPNYGGVFLRVEKDGKYYYASTMDRSSATFVNELDIDFDQLTGYPADELAGLKTRKLEVGKTSKDFVEIDNASQFEHLAWIINGYVYGENVAGTTYTSGASTSDGQRKIAGINIYLNDDIDLVSGGSKGIYGGNNFYGIGWSSLMPYLGSLDGGGHTLTVDIDCPEGLEIGVLGTASSSSGLQILGSYNETYLAVQNITVEGRIAGHSRVGIFAYHDNYAPGTLFYNDRKSVLYLTNVVNNADISGVNLVGGILGATSSTHSSNNHSSNYLRVFFENCVNNGTITGTAPTTVGRIGGLIGSTSFNNPGVSMTNSYNNGEIVAPYSNNVGGVAGYLQGYLLLQGEYDDEKPLNTGNVTGGGATGGIAGYLGFGIDNTKTGTIVNQGAVAVNPAAENPTLAYYIGGIAGQTLGGNFNNLKNRGDILFNAEKLDDGYRKRSNYDLGLTAAGATRGQNLRMGGIFGYAYTTNKAHESENLSNEGTVAAYPLSSTGNSAMHIGGVFGYINGNTNAASIKNPSMSGNVMVEDATLFSANLANYVGGVAGFVNSPAAQLVSVESPEMTGKVMVQAERDLAYTSVLTNQVGGIFGNITGGIDLKGMEDPVEVDVSFNITGEVGSNSPTQSNSAVTTANRIGGLAGYTSATLRNFNLQDISLKGRVDVFENLELNSSNWDRLNASDTKTALKTTYVGGMIGELSTSYANQDGSIAGASVERLTSAVDITYNSKNAFDLQSEEVTTTATSTVYIGGVFGTSSFNASGTTDSGKLLYSQIENRGNITYSDNNDYRLSALQNIGTSLSNTVRVGGISGNHQTTASGTADLQTVYTDYRSLTNYGDLSILQNGAYRSRSGSANGTAVHSTLTNNVISGGLFGYWTQSTSGAAARTISQVQDLTNYGEVSASTPIQFESHRNGTNGTRLSGYQYLGGLVGGFNSTPTGASAHYKFKIDGTNENHGKVENIYDVDLSLYGTAANNAPDSAPVLASGGLIGYFTNSPAVASTNHSIDWEVNGFSNFGEILQRNTYEGFNLNGYAGGIVGYMTGNLQNHTESSFLSLREVNNFGDITFEDSGRGTTKMIGGLLGYNNFSGNVAAKLNISDGYNSGTVKFEGKNLVNATTVYAGGVAGYLKGNTSIGAGITDSENAGTVLIDVSDTTVAAGAVVTYTGGVAGYTEAGGLENISNTGDVTVIFDGTSLAANSTATTGGIVGRALTGSTINRSYNTGNILISRDRAPVDSVYTMTNYTGGIAGFLYYGAMAESFNAGQTKLSIDDGDLSTAANTSYIGGLAGQIGQSTVNSGSICDSYNIGETAFYGYHQGVLNIGGLTGTLYSGSVDGKPCAYIKSSYSAGPVTVEGTSSQAVRAGAISGANVTTVDNTEDCYYDIERAHINAMYNNTNKAGVTGLLTSEMVGEDTLESKMAGLSDDFWSVRKQSAAAESQANSYYPGLKNTRIGSAAELSYQGVVEDEVFYPASEYIERENYAIYYDLTNIELEGGPDQIAHGGTVSIRFAPEEGYRLPGSIKLSVGGDTRMLTDRTGEGTVLAVQRTGEAKVLSGQEAEQFGIAVTYPEKSTVRPVKPERGNSGQTIEDETTPLPDDGAGLPESSDPTPETNKDSEENGGLEEIAEDENEYIDHDGADNESNDANTEPEVSVSVTEKNVHPLKRAAGTALSGLPDSAAADADPSAWSFYTYNSDLGVLKIYNVTGDVSVSAVGVPKEYNVVYDLENVVVDAEEWSGITEHGAVYETKLVAAKGYRTLTSGDVAVSVNGEQLSEGNPGEQVPEDEPEISEDQEAGMPENPDETNSGTDDNSGQDESGANENGSSGDEDKGISGEDGESGGSNAEEPTDSSNSEDSEDGETDIEGTESSKPNTGGAGDRVPDSDESSSSGNSTENGSLDSKGNASNGIIFGLLGSRLSTGSLIYLEDMPEGDVKDSASKEDEDMDNQKSAEGSGENASGGFGKNTADDSIANADGGFDEEEKEAEVNESSDSSHGLGVQAGNHYQPERQSGLQPWYTFDEDTGQLVVANITGEVIIAAASEIEVYGITYDLGGGELPEGKRNPSTYNVHAEDIYLENPELPGYLFSGWTGAFLEGPTMLVKIPSGTVGDLQFTATWKLKEAVVPVVNISEDTSIVYGQIAELEVTAVAGSEDNYTFRYQWYRGTLEGGTAIAGEERSTYRTPVGTAAGSHTYYCQVTAVLTENGETATAETDITTLVIEPKEITVNATGETAEKVYDGTVQYELVGNEYAFGGVISGDEVKLSAKAAYNSANVAEAGVITLTDLRLEGGAAANYKLPGSGTLELPGKISAKEADVIWDTEHSYFYNGEDQGSRVSAKYKEVFGDEVQLNVVFSGAAEMFCKPGTYTATAGMKVEDSNYILTGMETLLIMNKKVASVDTPEIEPVIYNPARLLSEIPLPQNWEWKDGNTVPGVATERYAAVYSPADLQFADYSNEAGWDSLTETIHRDVPLRVQKADPHYEIPDGLSAVYGDMIGSIILPEGFSWSLSAETPVGNAGLQSLPAAFTPADTVNYNIAELMVGVQVEKAIPKITVFPEASDLIQGQPLKSSLLLNGEVTGVDQKTLEGRFVWSDENVIPQEANRKNYTAIFMPKDSFNYTEQILEAEVTTNVETPRILNHPQNITIVESGVGEISVQVQLDYAGELTYQWYCSDTESTSGGEAIDGAVEAIYIIESELPGTKYYFVEVTNLDINASGQKAVSLFSDISCVQTVVLQNAEPPILVKNLSVAEATYNKSESATPLAVEASVTDGGVLSYQWYSNTKKSTQGGTAISGQTGAAYKPATNTAGTMYYYVIITNTNEAVSGSKSAGVVSNIATVTVKEGSTEGGNNGGGNGGGGSGGGGGGSSVSPPKEDPKPVEPKTEDNYQIITDSESTKIITEGEMKDRNIVVSLDKELVDKLISEAEKNSSDTIVLSSSVKDSTARGAEVSLLIEAVRKLTESVSSYIKVETAPISMVLTTEGLKELAGKGSETVNISGTVNGDSIRVEVGADGKNFEKVTGEIMVIIPNVSGSLAILVHEDGKEEIVRYSMVDEADTAYIRLEGSATLKMVNRVTVFDDVEEEAWYHRAVEFASSRELFSGVSEREFAPDMSMTRGMLVTVLHRLEGQPAAAGNLSFADTPGDMYYADAISWAAKKEIVKGITDDHFAPDLEITREQFAAIMYRYANASDIKIGGSISGSIAGFTDSEEVSEYAEEAVAWAVSAGLLSGKGDGTLDPAGAATRAEVASILQRFVKSSIVK